MTKTQIADLGVVRNLLFPYLPVLVGTSVNGKPNYITIGLVGWLCYDTISVSVGHKQYSNAGIRENGTFSINQPTEEMVKQLDYCGIYSGRRVDKSQLFDNFYGELGTAPLIKQCPINIECKVYQTLERPIHTVFIGEVVSVFVDTDYCTEGLPDITKIHPVFYGPIREGKKESGYYYSLGQLIGKAWSVGKDLDVPAAKRKGPTQ